MNFSLHKEIEFENEICAHLTANGWLYAEGDSTAYDRARALFPADLIARIQATQPTAWEALAKNHGASAASTLLDRLRKQLDDRGTLDVLRHLSAAIEPVADRLLKRYKAATEALKLAQAKSDAKAEQDAQNELNALILFKRNLGAFLRVYAFLSQIFDYGNTAIEKRAIFFERLLPLLGFGREREGVDLSRVVLTHHQLKDRGRRDLPLTAQDAARLQPMTEPEAGEVQEKEKALLAEIIEKVNDLFEGELTDDDKLVYVNNVLKGKLLESEILVQQAMNNPKGRFSDSPNLNEELTNAIIDAFAAHETMSKQALNSDKVRAGLKNILLGPAQLYEALQARGESRQ